MSTTTVYAEFEFRAFVKTMLYLIVAQLGLLTIIGGLILYYVSGEVIACFAFFCWVVGGSLFYTGAVNGIIHYRQQIRFLYKALEKIKDTDK